MEWLVQNPISNEVDILFVTRKIREFMKDHQNATAEIIARTRDQWSGIIPFLRIIHCITDFDSIREALLLSFQVMIRPELDGQHNENIRRNDPWVLIADKWNDTNYNLVSKTYPELHEEFTNEIDIGHAKVAGMGELTPEKAKQKYMKMKSQMVIVRSKWRASGNTVKEASRRVAKQV